MGRKRAILILFLFIIVLITIILFYTYAIDVKMDKTTGTADLTFNINITDTNGTTVTVPAGESKIFDFFLTNNNGGTIRYGLAYSGTKPDTVKIAQMSNSKNLVNSTISNNTTYQITLTIINNSDTEQTYTIAPVTGYQNGGNLPVPSGYTLITDIQLALPQPANDYIISLSQGDTYTEGNGNGVYQTNNHEYRYVGGEVNNYVLFNNDLYRIIGVFDDNSHGITGQKLVKLIAARKLTAAAWGAYNAASAYTTYSNYKNNWTGLDSDGNTTNGTGVPASANLILNEYYYNANSTSSTYGECINWTYGSNNNTYKSKNCSNIVGYGIQTNNLRNYIQPVTWYLYGYTSTGLSKQNWYNCERNNYSGCTSANSGAYQGTTTAPVGLMYVSDYLYASGYVASTATTAGNSYNFINLNWLYNGYEWTITPRGNSDTFAFYVNNTGSIGSLNSSYGLGLRPTFYLKSTIKIKSGDGTFASPYIIG